MNQLGLWEPQGGVSCWCPESGLNKVQLYAPKIWNSLPEDVRQASTLTVFTSRLKTVYLAVHMTTESILSALFAFNLIN